MSVFIYKAMDDQGQEVTGSVEADSSASAIAAVRGMGYFPTSITEKRTTRAARTPAAKKAGGMQITIKIPGITDRVSSKDLVQFTRQLATLIDAGLPLLRSLSVLARQQKAGALRNVIDTVREDVEKGASFSEALSRHPRAFTKLFVNMIRAGEAGGALETVLNRLADFAEKTRGLKRKVSSAMVYPVFVTIFAVGILTFLLVKVVPTFEQMFKEQGEALPVATQFLITASQTLRRSWYYPVGIVIGIVILYKSFYATRMGCYTVDKLKLYLPLFGPVARKIIIARFSRTLETLISSGVPILQALLITRDTVGNEVVARAISDVHDSIREGESIASPLEASGVFPLLVTNMIEVGEETGALDVMLTKIADGYEEEVDSTISGLTSILEPLLIIFMGLMVGFIVIALFVPLIKYAQSINAS